MSATPDSTFEDSGDEYEETIRQQRAENAALLASLDLSSGGSALVDPQGAKQKRVDAAAEERRKKRLSLQREKAAEERKKRRKLEAENPARPSRTSARLQGRTPEGVKEESKRIEKEQKEMEQKRQEAKKLLHINHELKALLGEETPETAQQVESLSQVFRGITDDSPADTKKGIAAKGSSSTDSGDVKELQSVLDKMQLLSVRKATPKRIYSAAFHPTTHKDLIFTGDKEGYISIWDPFAARPRNSDEDDEGNAGEDGITGEDGYSWNLRIPQDSSPISCIKIPPSNPTKLFSSSYNSTLRKIDLEKGVSEQVFSFAGDGDDDDNGETLLSVFDFQRDSNVPGGEEAAGGNIIWCGDHRGGVVRVDVREAGSKANRGIRGRNWQRWQLCEKKVGGLSLNPLSPHVLAVASLDQSIRLFDTRRLSTIAQTAEIPTTYKHVDPDSLAHMQTDIFEGGGQVGWAKSKQASTSVDFAPDGRHLAAVSYDDVVKVWDLDQGWLDTVLPAANGSSGNKKSSSTPKKEAASKGLMKYWKRPKLEEEDDGASILDLPDASRPRPKDILQKPLVIPHNNQTGKWLTLFRVRWSQNALAPAPHFTIGAMNRRIEIFSAEGKLLKSLYDAEWHSAVPAVCALHPNRVGRVVGGNASGRCVLWGVPEE